MADQYNGVHSPSAALHECPVTASSQGTAAELQLPPLSLSLSHLHTHRPLQLHNNTRHHFLSFCVTNPHTHTHTITLPRTHAHTQQTINRHNGFDLTLPTCQPDNMHTHPHSSQKKHSNLHTHTPLKMSYNSAHGGNQCFKSPLQGISFSSSACFI